MDNTVNIIVIDREGLEHHLEAPTDMGMNWVLLPDTPTDNIRTFAFLIEKQTMAVCIPRLNPGALRPSLGSVPLHSGSQAFRVMSTHRHQNSDQHRRGDVDIHGHIVC